MEIKDSDYAWLYKPLESDVKAVSIRVLDRQELVILLTCKHVEASFIVVLLDMSDDLVFEMLELSLVVVAVHYFKDRVFKSVDEQNLPVIVRDNQLEMGTEFRQVI